MLQENIIGAIEDTFGDSSPGFYIYLEPESEKYYAFYIDKSSKVLLLSKPYSTEHNCNNALQRFKQGKFTGDIKEDEQGFFIEFKSESGKMIGISPNFEGQTNAEQVLEQLSSQETPGEKEPPAARKEKKIAPQPAQKRGEDSPPRHSFRLDFYKGGKETPVRGRIEYSLTQESAAFEGLDLNFVRSFIARHLEGKETGAAPTEIGGGEIHFLENGRPSSKTIFSNAQAIEVELKVGAPVASTYDAFVYAKSLSDNRQTLIGRRRGEGSPICLSLFATGLPAGLYRLQATVHLEGKAEKGHPTDYSLASKLFHIFSEQAVEEEERLLAPGISK